MFLSAQLLYGLFVEGRMGQNKLKVFRFFPGDMEMKGWMVQTILTLTSTSLSQCAVIVAESWLLPHGITFAATLSVLKSLFPTYFSAAVTCNTTVS